MPGAEIRNARGADLDGLGALEARSFVSDHLARRSLKRLLGRPSACLRVVAAKQGSAVHGYSLVLFRKGSAVARLYSIAVDGERRSEGLGRRLLADAEAVAIRRKQRVLRLEVREDNLPAIRLYERRGYRLVGRYNRYYTDHADALRYEKQLVGDRSATAGSRRKRGA
jgi:ribosomal protein S18 acetylase RimI-like enzyme